jgi:hypothetical protein
VSCQIVTSNPFLPHLSQRCDGCRPICDACRNRNAEECVYEKSETDHHTSFRDVQEITTSSWYPDSLVSLRPKPSSIGISAAAVSPIDMRLIPSSSRLQAPADRNALHINLFLSIPENSLPHPLQRLGRGNFYPPLALEDVTDPYAFALSDVSLADLNMKL